MSIIFPDDLTPFLTMKWQISKEITYIMKSHGLMASKLSIESDWCRIVYLKYLLSVIYWSSKGRGELKAVKIRR
jgi:hypothetical protein